MNEIMSMLKGFIFFLCNLSFIFGIILILGYVIFNAYSNSRSFYKSSGFVKKWCHRIIDCCRVWGPNFIIFYIVGRLLVRLINFIG